MISYLQDKFPDQEIKPIVLQSAVLTMWNNSAMGCPKEGEFYLQALTPGYRITFILGEDELVTLHTNASGLRFVSPDFPDL